MANVTVIVPVYKVEEYLEKCYNSILNQRYKDIEIVLVDDGSPDNCGAMCDEFACAAEANGIPVYVIHQMNRGLSGARNSGIDWAMLCSDSKWLCFVDSDDTVAETFIEKLYNAAVENNSDLAVCDYRASNMDNIILDKVHPFLSGTITAKNELFDMLYHQWRLHPAWNKLYHKRIFLNLRFCEGKLHEDEYIVHEVLYLCKKVVFVAEELYYYLLRSSGIMGTQNRQTRKDGFNADFIRYWFCKNHQLPLDPRLLGLDYMIEIKEFNDKDVLSEYKKIYFDFPSNRTIKNRLQFRFYRLYKWYRKRRLGE